MKRCLFLFIISVTFNLVSQENLKLDSLKKGYQTLLILC